MERLPTYEKLYASFRWNIPARYNIAADVCDRHAADPDKIALIGEGPGGKTWRMTFREVQRKANQLANVFVSLGLAKGDRVMLLLGQNPWTAIGHVACWKAGLVSVPVSALFAADAVAYRLNLVGARVLITDRQIFQLPCELPRWRTEPVRLYLVDGRAPEAESLMLKRSNRHAIISPTLTPPRTIRRFLNFTSGTTGNPKGALQAHRSMLGHLPGAEFGLDFFPAARRPHVVAG